MEQYRLISPLPNYQQFAYGEIEVQEEMACPGSQTEVELNSPHS